jgi:hypothetical protein
MPTKCNPPRPVCLRGPGRLTTVAELTGKTAKPAGIRRRIIRLPLAGARQESSASPAVLGDSIPIVKAILDQSPTTASPSGDFLVVQGSCSS